MLNNTIKKYRPTKITIIGGGLCGLMMALYLAKRGYFVDVYDKENNKNVNSVSDKRATNLDLSQRGLLALYEMGLLDKVLSKSVPTHNRILFCGTETLTIPHGLESKDIIYNVSRFDLYDILSFSAKKQPNINVNFSHELVSVDTEKNLLFFKITNDNTMIAKSYSHVLGCDGINSVMRHVLNNKYNYNKNYSHSYKNSILPIEFIKENLSSKNMYKWMGKQVAFIAHPNIKKYFNITLLLPSVLENSFLTLFDHKNFPHLQSVREYLSHDFTQQEFNRIKSTKVACQHKGNILLLGDAAHGILPFLGQGINCAFEDCRLLNEHLSKHEDNWEKATKNFDQHRKIDTNAIIDMSEVEYQDFKQGYDFKKNQFIERIKAHLSKRHPDFFQSHRYLLAFTHDPYEKINQYHQLQQQILAKIWHHFKTIDSIDWETVDKWITTMFKECTMPYCCHY